MGHIHLNGSPPITVALRRSARARRLSLRISRLDGRVTLTLPKSAPLREAEGFVREKEAWIRGHLQSRPTAIAPRIGGQILFEGREVAIISGTGRSARFQDGALQVPPEPEKLAQRLSAYLKLVARQRLQEASEHYSEALGRPFGRLTMRDTRSRWGSCSSEGNLMYSWRLIMAPPDVLRYVAAHEVAHLQEMNHSAAFWNVVEDLYPDYQAPRLWLRENGEDLHRYKFDG